jgi:hypothetical protein
MTFKGRAYQKTFSSLRKNPTAKIKTSGKMQMRWYQQSTQGGSIMILLKSKIDKFKAIIKH